MSGLNFVEQTPETAANVEPATAPVPNNSQMASGNPSEEQTQLFRNLRKAWSDVMETQFMHV